MDDSVVLADHVAAHTDRIWRVRASNNGTLIASCSADCSIALWTVSKDLTMRLVQRLWPEEAEPVIIRDCAFASNDQRLVAAAYNGAIYVYDQTNELTEENPFQLTIVISKAHEKEIKSVDVSKYGTVASCSRDRAVSFWRPCDDSLDYECVGLFQNHVEDIKSVRFSGSGKHLVSASYDNNIYIYERRIDSTDELGDEEIETWVFVGGTCSTVDSKSCELGAPDSEIIAAPASCHTVWAAMFTRDSRTVITSDGNGCVRSYSVEGGDIKQLGCAILHGRRPIYDICLLDPIHDSQVPDTWIATAGQDGSIGISIVRSITGIASPVVYISGAHDGEVNAVCDMSQLAAFRKDVVICSGGDDGFLNVWRVSMDRIALSV